MGGGKRNFSRSAKRLASEKRPWRYTRGLEIASSYITSGDQVETGSFALGAFVEANLHGFHGVQQLRAALGEKIGEAGGRAGADQRRAIFRFEAFAEAKLFRLEWIAIEMRIQVQVMDAQTQRRAQNNFVEDGGGSS